jgi:hypothetical protein
MRPKESMSVQDLSRFRTGISKPSRHEKTPQRNPRPPLQVTAKTSSTTFCLSNRMSRCSP